MSRTIRLIMVVALGLTGSVLFEPGAVLANAAPTTVAAQVEGSSTVRVTWSRVSGAVGYYVVPVTAINGVATEITALRATKDGDSTAHLFQNLANGTSYTFRVSAIHVGGISAFKESGSVTPKGPPGQPVVSVAPADGQLTVSWPEISLNGGVLTGYTVELYLGGSVVGTLSPTSRTATFSNLTNDTTYQAKVTVTTDAGSASSELQPGTPTVGVAPPTGIQATGLTGAVTLQWTPPVQTGGEILDEYTIEMTAPSSASRSVSGSTTSYTWTGLSSGVSHRFRLKSVNALGAQSAWSVFVQATPLGASDSPPQGGGGTPAVDIENGAPAGRIGGDDRFHTAALISQQFFAPGVDVVFLATGAGFADALAAGPAALGDGPVLLVRRDSIPATTAVELDRLNPRRIVVLGGESVVAASVLEAARAYTSGTVTRLGGVDRYATAVQVSATTFAPGVDVVFLATGLDFADALTAGPVGAPVLLTRPTCVPRIVLDEVERLGARNIWVLGGTTAASTAVRNLRSCS